VSLAGRAGAAVFLCVTLLTAQAGAAVPADTRLVPLAFADVPGWAADDHAAALAVFRSGCAAPATKPALPKGATLTAACRAANALPARPSRGDARAFFEAWFSPSRVEPASGAGFFTGYFEPEFAGSAARTARHPTPLLAMPKALPSPAPDRAAIEAGALGGAAVPLVWLDPVDAFFVHIQGSARIRLETGEVVRVGFAGRNGLPFTAIGKLLVERGALTREEASMQTIRAWLADHPADAPALMRQNGSYIFFKIDRRGGTDGPIGAQNVPLTAGRSLAIDRTVWPYGLPVWVSARLPTASGEAQVNRLLIAQDTGAAIKGAARGDIFLGSGDTAGHIAGLTKHPGAFVVLLPGASASR
jgi:membrane-bound lytic murein transglycosylase A